MPIDFAKVSHILSERKQAEKIKGRSTRHYSQKALLSLIKQPPTVWKRLEKSNHLPVSDARKIANYLGVPIEEIWVVFQPQLFPHNNASNQRIIEYLVSIENLAKEIRELLTLQAHN